jgi:hypothetical protein
MSLQHALIRARGCVQRGQVDAAIKLYRGLLVSFAHHPQVNADLGLLLLQHRSAQEAIPYLSRAVAALPTALQPWVCLVIAHQRCGDLVSAREVLAQMHAQGFDAAQLAVYEQELNEPTPEAVQALTVTNRFRQPHQRRDSGPNDGAGLPQQCDGSGLFGAGLGDGGGCAADWGGGVAGGVSRQTARFGRAPFLRVWMQRSPYAHRLECWLCQYPE